MSGTDIVEQFADLFDGRTDAYGTNTGGCVRGPLDWDQLYYEHLRGVNPIGIYPTRSDDTCKFGAVDFDRKSEKHKSFDYETEDACHIAAVNLQKTLRALGAESWIERTRSQGRHVWLFAQAWVPASVMRRALLVACSVAGVSKREVNPKAETGHDKMLGNYINLPYPGGEAFTKRAIFIGVPPWEDSVFEHVEDWVPLALEYRTPIATLEHIASLYKPKQSIIAGKFSDLVDRTRAARGLNALARHLYDKPVDQISDRSMHIEAFVRASKDSGLTASETLTLAGELAARCGKFDGRRDREDQLRRIVERAWT